MTLTWLIAVQAASPAPSGIITSEFDLAQYRPAEPSCGAGDGSEIVVCGRRSRQQEYGLKMDPRWVDKPVRAEIGLGGGATLRAYVESAQLPGGQVSNRAMIGIKLPF